MGRFILYTCMTFITAFVGVSWATRGLQTRVPPPVVLAPLGSTLTSAFGQDSDSTREQDRRRWLSQHTAQSDKNPKLDVIRMDALQAATAYAMSPCDSTMKLNLIAATTAYTHAWQAKLDCPRPMNMLVFCSDRKVKDAADTFSTPLDRLVHDAMHAAFRQKGVVTADFPADVRFDVRRFAGPGLWFRESPICLPRQRGSANPTP
jgi:hypothetical protein